jgi:hypothetical protein
MVANVQELFGEDCSACAVIRAAHERQSLPNKESKMLGLIIMVSFILCFGIVFAVAAIMDELANDERK